MPARLPKDAQDNLRTSKEVKKMGELKEV